MSTHRTPSPFRLDQSAHRIAAPRRIVAAAQRRVFELVRLATMLLILRPAARVLPLRAALLLPWSIGRVLAGLPKGRRIQGEFKQAFRRGPHDPAAVTRSWVSMQYRDYVLVMRALVRGVEVVPGAGDIEVHSPADTRLLLETDTPVLVAVAHFRREGFFSFFREGVFPRRILLVVAPMPEGSSPAETRRLGEHYGALLRYAKAARADTQLFVRGSGSLGDLVAASSQPGWSPNIHIDAPISGTPSHSFARPFAGRNERRFATGTARIARAAQLPTVLLLTRVSETGRVVFTYSSPFPPPAVDDARADERLTSQLLDEVEKAIGRYPDQYVFKVGHERIWNPDTETWEPSPTIEQTEPERQHDDTEARTHANLGSG